VQRCQGKWHWDAMDLGQGQGQGQGQVIAASRQGSILRVINHSREPETQVQKWTAYGLFRGGMFVAHCTTHKEEAGFGPQGTFNLCLVMYNEDAKECPRGHPGSKTLVGAGQVEEEDGD
ncbi:unnamed protein product, partial [Discosporangium mesarthrocarpum]